MMNRNPFIAALAAITVFSWLIADSGSSEAQLFRRFRQRIQSRTNLPPVPADQRQPRTRTRQQPNVPRYTPQQSPNQPSVTPRRVAPVNPSGSDADGAASRSSADRPATTAPANTPADRSRVGARTGVAPRMAPGGRTVNRPPVGSPSDPKADTVDDRFGPSILPNNQVASEIKPTIGIRVVPARQGTPGLQVTGFNPGSLAASAGLKVGDLIVSLDGQPTSSVAEISRLLTGRKGGDKVQLRIVRDANSGAIIVPLIGAIGSEPLPTAVASGLVADQRTATPNRQAIGSQDNQSTDLAADANAEQAFGLSYTNIDGQRGALVTEIQPDSPASTAGLKTGDRIVAVDGRLLINAQALKETLGQRKDSPAIDLRMVRDGKLLSANIVSTDDVATDSLIAGDGKATSGKGKKTTLGGVGKLLGGLLGGKPKPEPKDEMALGDDEGVQQVDFETEIATKDEDRSPDPVSLKALAPPTNGETEELLPPKQDSEKSPEQLKREIEELERQLKELKAKTNK